QRVAAVAEATGRPGPTCPMAAERLRPAPEPVQARRSAAVREPAPEADHRTYRAAAIPALQSPVWKSAPEQYRQAAGRASSQSLRQLDRLFNQPLRLPATIVPGNCQKDDQERQQRHLDLREAHRHEPQPSVNLQARLAHL